MCQGERVMAIICAEVPSAHLIRAAVWIVSFAQAIRKQSCALHRDPPSGRAAI